MNTVQSPLKLPCGVVLPNRLAKSSMSENMARHFAPDRKFVNAYRMWAEGETGLLISGNVMVDSRHLGEPNNVVIEKGLNHQIQLKNWANSVAGSKSHLWLQLNHPGKQSPKYLNHRPVAPSAVPLFGKFSKGFYPPRELSVEEILEIVERFGDAARVAKECGFHGVQIHGAHGYLVSQFLSPRHNIRTDEYGGKIENRMRFVRQIYLQIRKEVGPSFPIGIKLNSADFSKGGFSNEEAVFVAQKLSELGIDLIEISGGSYEAPAMTGVLKESTKKREAYFLEYTKEMKRVLSCPLMVTGGFRTREFIEEVVANNEVDLVGLARPLALDPSFSQKIFDGEAVKSQVKPLTSGLRALDTLFPLEIIWYTYQIHRMGKNKLPKPKASIYSAMIKTLMEIGTANFKKPRA